MTKIDSKMIAALLLALPALLAQADGGGGGGGVGRGAMAQPADPDFAAGVGAWKRKDWPAVIASMDLVIGRQPGNADAWNYRAHAYRQLGEIDKSFKDYERALSLDPKHRAAREYLGEAYLQIGNLAKAEEQLRLLDQLCWLPCEEYSDLKQKIADYKQQHPQAGAQ